jgi:serine/threonine-protein kinase
MSLESLGQSLADRYRLERELGAGGMATVYLAHDLKHERDVAIKVLHPDLGAALGAERFLTEIRTTARLQHPHILPLLDSGTVVAKADRGDPAALAELGGGGAQPTTFLYYVMPLVTGETLRARLERERQLPIADAVRIAREVASALDYAHRHGVIHRDIKPENILLHDGQAMVADFGIALAVQSAGGQRMTQTGLSLGTPQYMSPEQAMGEKQIDARSDVYALAAVTYEMLAGDAPFTGGSVQAIVAKIMTEKPTPVHTLRDTVPEHVEDAVLTGLAKLPADRFASAAEFAAALAGGLTTGSLTRATQRTPAGNGRWRMVSAALGVATIALAALAAWALTREPTASGPSVYDVATPDSARISFITSSSRVGTYGAVSRSLSISADGAFAVYVALQPDSVGALWYRSLLNDEIRPIPGTAGASAPRISPDGSQVAYFGPDQVMVVSLAGGEPRPLVPIVGGAMLGWLSPNEILALGSDGDLALRLDPGGSEPSERAIVRCPLGIWAATLGELLCSFNGSARTINLETDATREVRAVQADGTPGGPLAGSDFRLIDGRYMVFISPDGVVSAARYDPESSLVQRVIPLLPGIRREALGQAQFDISENGTLIYAPGIDATTGRLVRRVPGSMPQLLPIEAANFQRYDLSRDGRWLAAVVQGTSLNELRIYDLRTGQHTVWQRAEIIRHPMWSPDGQAIIYASRTADQWSLVRGSPGSGEAPDTVARYSADGVNFDPVGYLNDSTAMGQDWTQAIVTRFDPRAASATMDTVLTSARFPSVSANGQLIAYQSKEGSRIMVTTFPNPGRRWQIASQGAEPLMLSPSTVLFRQGAVWYTVSVNPETGEPSGAPVMWATDPRFSDTSGWSNVPTHDGGIIYVQGPEQASPGYFRVIPNWVAQMKRAVDGGSN